MMCGVSGRTVIKNFADRGRLKFYRIPGSQHRRFKRDDLVEFLKERNIWDGIPLVSRRLLGLEDAESQQ
jgi:excisionase family DNA binding protein